MKIYTIEVNTEEEFNQTIQQYLIQGFKVESNIGDTCILKKKGYNTGILIVLLILGILLGLIYYLLCNDETVIIRKVGSGSSINSNTSPQIEIESYCVNCGAPLAKDTQFCSNCGYKIISKNTEEIPKNNESKEEEKIEVEGE